MKEKFGCIIIGGGAAGLASAIVLQNRGAQATVVERMGLKKNNGTGETLTSSTQNSLKHLGISKHILAQNFLPCYSNISLWDADHLTETNHLLDLYGCGWHINKGRFNKILIEKAVGCGVHINYNTKYEIINHSKDGWLLRLKSKKGEKVVRAKVLVDATGKSAHLSRKLGEKRIKLDRQIAFNAVAPSKYLYKKYPNSLLLESTKNGWWYASPICKDNSMICFLTDANLISKKRDQRSLFAFFYHQLAATKFIKSNISPDFKVIDFFLCPAESSYSSTFGGKNWLGVGDAAFSMDPLSGQGVKNAMESGIVAAEVISKYLNKEVESLDSYIQMMKKRFTNYQVARRTNFQKMQKWKDAPFWASRINQFEEDKFLSPI